MADPDKSNGIHYRLDKLESGITEIRDDLPVCIEKLSCSVERLCDKFDNFITVAQSSIPIKAVFWLLAIMVLGLVGIEGVKALGPALAKLWAI